MNYEIIKNWYEVKYKKLKESTWRPKVCYNYFAELLEKHTLKKGTILDIGCGTGYFLAITTNKGFKPYGIDISEEAIKITKKQVPDAILINENMDNILDGEFSEKTFDNITLLGSMEHSLNIDQVIKNIYKLGDNQTTYLIVVPNKDFILYKFSKNKGTEQQEINECLLTIDEWKKLFSDFEIIKIYKDTAIPQQFKNPIKQLLSFLLLKFVPLKYTFQFCFVLRKFK